MSKNKEFFGKINEAFANGDIDFIVDNVTEDIQWIMVGMSAIHGKGEFIKAMEMMEPEKVIEYTTTNMIVHGNTAAIEGKMKMMDKSGVAKSYGFCDIYRLDKFTNGKVQEMTSYAIELDKH
ncbi:nuclear transport factor 2 family protein [Alteribacter populi]|uniref:nuclear transport factor 2 family protein n=1 Tax=Alteribacter populi TaxID=2011011 RepID=UPI0012FFC235|nr:nuclear transport factor 2 family protein [Alteribacter populi]